MVSTHMIHNTTAQDLSYQSLASPFHSYTLHHAIPSPSPLSSTSLPPLPSLSPLSPSLPVCPLPSSSSLLVILKDEKKEPVCMNQYVIFIVGAGKFGGKKSSPVVKVSPVAVDQPATSFSCRCWCNSQDQCGCLIVC